MRLIDEAHPDNPALDMTLTGAFEGCRAGHV
jgi:hypothetical protein